MKQKAKLRPLERVVAQEVPVKAPKVRPHRHNTMGDSIREAPVLLAQIRAKIAKDTQQEECKTRIFNAMNQVSMNPGQVRTILGPRGSVTMNTPTREDYKKKRGQSGKSGAPLSLEALRAAEFKSNN